jgi:nucleotide-binding universal stress UspA family protein
VELSKENHFDLLVISNSDERGLLTKLFGSVALEVAHKAHCPVLLVPHKAKYKGITDIAYATSEMSADEDGIAVVTDWAKSHNAKIHFLHVTQPHKFSELPDVTAMMRSHKGVDYAVKDLEFVSIKGGIDTYCDTRPIDMIVSMTRDYSFWDSLFRNSVTDYLAWNNTLPLLVLHKDVVEAK